MFASRASIWPRVHFWRTTIASRLSRPTTWNEFLPMSMPKVTTVGFVLRGMAVLLLLGPLGAYSGKGWAEHGRTIPLPDIS